MLIPTTAITATTTATKPGTVALQPLVIPNRAEGPVRNLLFTSVKNPTLW